MDNNSFGIDVLDKMGFEMVELNNNRIKIKLPIALNSNHFGAMYAGSIFTLAEFPFGYLYGHVLGFSEMVPVVGEMTIRYLAPAFEDLYVDVEVDEAEWKRIEEETKAHGKLKLQREVEVLDAKGEVKAVVSSTYFSLLQR